jgi:hypothetical protein
MDRFAAGLLVLVLLTSGCSSSYRPADSPRISTALSGGSPTFFRDGKEYSAGLFLGGVEDAVQGNRRAEEEARTAHHLMVGGLVLTLIGEGTAISGLALEASHPTQATQNAGLALALGGLAGAIAGFILVMNAPPHMYDAINIYNDGIAADGTATPDSTAAGKPLSPASR